MSPDEFRASGHQVVDMIADYLRDIRDLPVQPDVQPGQLMDALPAKGPEQGESMDAILAGSDGSLTYDRGSDGAVIPGSWRDRVPAVNGYGVELTDPDGYLVRLWDERSMNEK